MKWKPEWGEERIHDMVAERPDWCISRQRFWGVPLIIFYCDACGKQLKRFSGAAPRASLFRARRRGRVVHAFGRRIAAAGQRNAPCGGAKWRKESDVLDVWFDSGSTHLAVLSEKDGTWPADVYLEGPDQYRGWFHSSLLVGVGTRGARRTDRW